MRRAGGWVVGVALLGAALLTVLGAELRATPHGQAQEVAVEARTDYEASLERLEGELAVAERFSAADPGSWLKRSRVALVHLDMARLTGEYDRYAAAERELDRAFEDASEGAGPFLYRASLHQGLHRFAAAERDLEQLRQERAGLRSEVYGQRGDIALSRGDVGAALAWQAMAVEAQRSWMSLARLANLRATLGEVSEAEALYAEAATLLPSSGRHRAWLELQRGLLALKARRYGGALAAYQRADRAFSGWWLIEEHMAEALALLGERERAEAIYERLVARTSNPEFMDALARLIEARAPERARELRRRATALYEERMARFPEATARHGIGHFLEDAPDPVRAEELALVDLGARPGSEAYTSLAQARLLGGSPERALDAILPALEGPLVGAETHATAALIFERLGEGGLAEAERREALALDVRLDAGAGAVGQ